MNRASMRWRLPALALAVLALAGCASPAPEQAFAPVQQAARDHLGKDVHWARTEADRARLQTQVSALLAQPLTMDAAVQLALLNNRGLQANFAALALSDAQRAQATRLPNPGISFGRISGGGERELEWGLHLDLARVLALPMVRTLEARRFERDRLASTEQVLSLAAQTRAAWVQAVAAEESVRYAGQVRQAAQASAELARRMAQVGNFTQLERAREQSFLAEAELRVAQAEQLRLHTREQLTRLLGLWGEQTAFRLPQRLPDLPQAPRALPTVERTALETRLDVQGARAAVAQTADNLGLSRATRFVNVFEVGALRKDPQQGATERGWEIALELPLFDWGDARIAQAEALYLQAFEQAAQTAIDARSEVREAYGQYRLAWDVARHHREVLVPLRQRISEENLLRYNGMLIGVFELLADARAQIAAVDAAIGALRDFWLAQARLDMAMLGRTVPSPAIASPLQVSVEPAGAAH